MKHYVWPILFVLERYMSEVEDGSVKDALKFWRQREQSYPLLDPLGQDLVSAPASQAYVERVFFNMWRLVCTQKEPHK